MRARLSTFAMVVATSTAVSAILPAALAQGQYAGMPYSNTPYGIPQYGLAGNNAPMYAVAPAYLGQPGPSMVRQAATYQQTSQHGAANNRVTVRDDGTAAVSDSDPYYAPATGSNFSAESSPLSSIPNAGDASPQSSSGFAFASDLERAVEQPYAGPPQLDAPPPRRIMGPPTKLIPTVSGGKNLLVDDPNAPPAPNSLSDLSNSSQSNQSDSSAEASESTGNSSASSCSSCDCDSCQCDSCQCGSCNSCGGNCCCHKLFPIFNIQDCCPLTCEDCPTDHLFSENCWLKCHDITVTGWLDGGIEANGRNTPDNYNGPLTFPDRRDGQGNQAWFAIDRSAPADNCGWFVGGHVDYFFGSDYFFTTAAGLDGTSFGNIPRWNTTDSFLYGFSMPQLYAETDYGTDTKIKWRHFFTIIGYEVVPAIGNFFYSHSYTMQYGEPFTHTGMLASQTHCNWTFYGGITAGWNTFST
ncbi:MAG TPA: outer membrane beta-barrel protein, partial [Pirellulales bacterium]